MSEDSRNAKGGMPLWQRGVLVLVPVIIFISYVVIFYFMLDQIVFGILMGAVFGYGITPFGPEVVIPAGIIALETAGYYSLTYLVVVSVVFVDVMIAFFMLLNFEIIEAIPYLGKWVKKAEESLSRKVGRKEGLALSMLVLYVAMPFQGSGGFVGSIMGRLVGLNRYKVFAAVCSGAMLGAVPIGIAAHYGYQAFLGAVRAGAFLYAVSGIAIILIFTIAVAYFARKEQNRKEERKESKGKGAGSR